MGDTAPVPGLVVAIDGTAGSGKSTTARAVAAALGLPVLDTGAMYRAVTLAALRAGVDPHDAEAVTRIARTAVVEIENGTTRLDGEDVSAVIRAPDVTAAVSVVAAHPDVRAELVERQRAWVAAHGGGVVEGRDIGTVVFPAAPVKVFLVAADDARALRRQRDEAAARREVDLDAVRAALERRDELDASRPVSPLRPAEDALVIDTTQRAVEEVVELIVGRARAAAGEGR